MRDDLGAAQQAGRAAHPLPGSLGTYAGCIAAAVVVGVVFDRIGAPRTAAALAAVLAMLLGMRDFRVFAVLTVFLLPFLPTAFPSQMMAGLSGQKLIGMSILATGAALFVAIAMRPGQLRIPSWRPALLAYLAVFVGAALNGARSVGQIPEYFRALGVFRETGPLAYLQVILFAPMLVVAVAAVAALLVANTRRAGWILVPVFSSAVLLSLSVCLQAFGAASTVADLAQQEARRTLSALGLHANEIGLLLNMVLVQAMCALGQARSPGSRVVLGGVALTLIAGVLMTFSRGAFLGLTVVVVYTVLVCRRGAWPVLIVVGLTLAVASLSDAVLQRALHGIGGNDIDLISSGRVDQIWRPLLPELAKHPVVGGGHASILWSDAAQSRSILPVGHPHSAYLGSLLDVGIVGSAITALYFVHAWRLLRRTAAELPPQPLQGFFQGAAACILLLLVQGLTDDSFMPGFTHAYMWLAYGAAVGIAARPRPNPAAMTWRLVSHDREGDRA